MELFPISPKIPRLFPEIPRFFPSIAIAWSHGSQPAATDLRLRTRGLARVSGAGVWKIPAVGYHPAGETPELRNSGTWDLQRYRWWSALTNPTRLAFKSHDAYYLRWRKYLPQFRIFYLKFGESWPARIRNAPQFKFLTIFVLTPRLSKMAMGNPLQNGGFSLLGKEIWAKSSWALLVYGWFGGYTTQYLGILISA